MRQWLAGAVVGGLLGGVTAALVVLALVPQVTRAAPDDQVQPVVRTQRLDLVDSRGQSRATLDLDDEGATRFILADQDGVISPDGAPTYDTWAHIHERVNPLTYRSPTVLNPYVRH